MGQRIPEKEIANFQFAALLELPKMQKPNIAKAVAVRNAGLFDGKEAVAQG